MVESLYLESKNKTVMLLWHDCFIYGRRTLLAFFNKNQNKSYFDNRIFLKI